MSKLIGLVAGAALFTIGILVGEWDLDGWRGLVSAAAVAGAGVIWWETVA